MKLSRLNKMLAGIVIIFAGIGLFLGSLNIIDFNLFRLWPLIFLYFGMKQWEKNRRVVGGVLSALGIIFIFNEWFHINVFQLVITILLVYFGYRMIRSHKAPQEDDPPPEIGTSIMEEQEVPPPPPRRPFTEAPNPRQIIRPKESRSVLIGDFHLTSGRFELENMHIWHGIGDIVVDLSRAVIQEQESFLVINGWIGDITIYVPVDLPVAVSAEVTIGDLEVLNHRQGGLNRQIVMRSENYDQASRKVKLNISLIVGDVDVKYI